MVRWQSNGQIGHVHTAVDMALEQSINADAAFKLTGISALQIQREQENGG